LTIEIPADLQPFVRQHWSLAASQTSNNSSPERSNC